MKRIILLSFLLWMSHLVTAQMVVDGDTLLGNEWIKFNQEYFKIKVAEDGLYRISYAELENAGVPVSSVSMEALELIWMGQEVAMRTSGSGNFEEDSFIEFYGKKNRGEMDRFLYENPEEEMLNPDYSIITDTSTYFLTWSEGNHLRYEEIDNDLSGSLPSPLTHYMHNDHRVYTSWFYKPTHDGGSYLRYSNMDVCEGFSLPLVQEREISFTPDKLYEGGINLEFNIRFGSNSVQHLQELYIDGTLRKSYEFSQYKIQDDNFEIDVNQIGETIGIRLLGTKSDDKNLVSIASLKYPRLWDFNGSQSFSFSLEKDASERYIEIDNFDTTDGVGLYDYLNEIYITPVIDGGKVKVKIPASEKDHSFILINYNSGFNSVIGIEPVSFIDYSEVDHDYIILSHNSLFDDGGGNNYVQEYASFRSSMEGGSYDPIIVDVNQLYDQFGYGIDRHFLSLRNFGLYVHDVWEDLKYVFILGKGREYATYRTEEDILDPKNSDYSVPTFGFPGSDNLLLASLEDPKAFIPIGRLAAKNTDDIKWYLDKVRQHYANFKNPQTKEDQLWKKNVLHLSGGDATIQATIRNNLAEMEGIIESGKFGGDVTTFYKQSSEAIESAISDQIFDLINNGLSIITFFGHSGVGGFDFSLDNVSNYENFGKYPLVFSLGCYSGNIHTSNFGISEEFVVQKDKGAIAFIASTGTAYAHQQYLYGRDYYKEIGGDQYGNTIGDILNDVVDIYNDNLNVSSETFLQQLTLHGDPAIELLTFRGPDYIVDPASVYTDPTFVSTYLDGFEVCFDILNLGSAVPDSFNIFVQHVNPDGEVEYENIIRRKSPSYKDNYCLTIPISNFDLVGLNTIHVEVDYNNEIAEFPIEAESNNRLVDTEGNEGYSFYILNNSALPIYPKEFSIHSKEEVVLRASTYNALGEKQDFFLEIDTTEKFNSVSLKTNRINNVSGLIEWDLGSDFIEGQEYYWRVSPDSSTTNIGYVWNGSSFIYQPSSDQGWSQSEYFQFNKDDFKNLRVNQNEDWEYATNFFDIRIVNKYRTQGAPPQFIVNGKPSSSGFRWQYSPSIGVVIMDTLGKFTLNEVGGGFGSHNPFTYEIYTHYYDVSEKENRLALINLLDNELMDGTIVFLFTVHKDAFVDFKVEDWEADSIDVGENIFSVLEKSGATLIRDQLDGVHPYTIIYKKGIAKLSEERAETLDGTIDILESVPGLWYEGSVKSQVIGPATEWNRLVWDETLSEQPQNDTTYINILGIRPDGQEDTLYTQVVDKTFSLVDISAEEYPNIQLEYFSRDVLDYSSPDLEYWKVYYTGIGDAVLSPGSDFTYHSELLKEGDVLRIKMPASNFTNIDLVGLKVTFTVIDDSNESSFYVQDVPDLNADSEEILSFELNTKGLSGKYKLIIELNKEREVSECFYFNNFALAEFEVERDKINPILDVTFDGIHILDNDIVSAKPLIVVELRDENPFLPLEDTSSFNLLLTHPSGEIEQVQFTDPRVNFIPADGSGKNVARIEYLPILEEDGTYRLTVEGYDATDNSSGDMDFSVSFRVILEEMISNVFNYPNPFSTSTQFIFTLTGDEVPDYFKIQILTLSGKVVREITIDELGPLKVGLNRTEFKWNGTDEYGDKLANGVYLYKVVTRKQNGELYSKFQDETQATTDHFFTQEFGKMVIMR